MSTQEVRLRIQIIDIEPKQIDVTVPRYLAADNLSQRVIRDAGLQSHWKSGYRRNYMFRARGRVIHPKETLEHLGVVDGELIYLLPDPDPAAGVIEQNPEYPIINAYLGQGLPKLIGTISLVLLFSFFWGMALTTSQHWVVITLPSLGLATLCVSFARHAWGGRPSQVKIGFTAFTLYIIALGPPLFAPVLRVGISWAEFLSVLGPGIIMGIGALIISWLAWWAPVEPLTRRAVEENRQAESEALPCCGICGREVQNNVRAVCQYNCVPGEVLHSGCMEAKILSFKGDKRLCPIHNVRIS